ncbi:MAG: helix-turn-helix domain-containing protein [Clostridiales bacterium]|nr:helix-turn-helix domain-containing protein [Clostridiales bacterium]
MEINIQEKINRAMKHAKVSQGDIAKAFGVTQGAISQRLKTGKFSEDELKIIADVLGAKYFSGFEFPDGEKIY